MHERTAPRASLTWPAIALGVLAASCKSASPPEPTASPRETITRDEPAPRVRKVESHAGAYINANGGMPCAPHGGGSYIWEEPEELLEDMPDALAVWNPCTGNLVIEGDGGLTYNTELLFNANPPPGPNNPLGGPTGWNWNMALNWWITPTSNGVVLTTGNGMPFNFVQVGTSGSLTYYEDQQLESWNLINDTGAKVWRLQMTDGSELDFTQQTFGIQLSSSKNKIGVQLFQVQFDANGHMTSVTDYKGRTLIAYGYYAAPSPSAGRIQTITPLDKAALTLTYDEVNFGDLVQIQDAGGGGCQFKYVSHMLMQMDCADQEWLFDVFQNGGLANITEPDGAKRNFQYNRNPDGTTNVLWQTISEGVPPDIITFTAGNNQDPASRPWVSQFTNHLGISVQYDRTPPPASQPQPPSQPGPLMAFTDVNKKKWVYGYQFAANDPTGGLQFIQRPNGKHLFDATYCTAGQMDCPPTVPGASPAIKSAVDTENEKVVFTYYTDPFGTATYREVKSAAGFDPSGTALDVSGINIDTSNGVVATETLNGVPVASATMNATLTFINQLQSQAGADNATPNPADMPQTVSETTVSGAALSMDTYDFDDRDVLQGVTASSETLCVMSRDAILRPTGETTAPPGGSCMGGGGGGAPVLTVSATYPPAASDRGDMSEEKITGIAGELDYTASYGCEDYQLVSDSLDGVQDQKSAAYPSCTNPAVMIPSQDAGVDSGADASMPPPPVDAASDSSPPIDAGPGCTPGCKSQINIYFYDACCIEYDVNGKIIKDQIVQAAVCTNPDGTNNLCYSWDDTSSTPQSGTWGSNCPTGGPDPCFPYEM